MTPRTDAGRRLLWMFATTDNGHGHRWPRAFDARLAERIVEDFVPRVEAEASEVSGAVVKMGDTLLFEWGTSVSWGRVVSIGGSESEYTVTVQRQGGTPESDSE